MSDASPEAPSEEGELPTIFDACTPRQDVLIGELAEDQFAASLADVAHSDDAPDVYSNPELFFEKTFPTDGLQELLGRLATRFVSYYNDEYSGTNGVLRLDTSFGGGKTHNQIAAYHLAEQPDAVPDLSDFLDDEGVADNYGEAAALGLDVNTAVFVGTHVDGTSARCDYTDPNAPETKTMWGELAYQLFGQEGYEFLRENDEQQSPPGSQKLERLFDRHDNPSLVLIDEIAAYLEQTAAVEVGDSTLAKQTNTFLMSLLSATQNTDQLTVVLSIADTAFHDRAEDVRGLVAETISEFNSITDRTEGSITPTEDEEVASVLGHRLFEDVPDAAREATADAYASFYNGDRESFPEHASSMEHRERLAESYPIHPTVIDTLTEELDSLPSFQKTRGALRLLSRGIHQLWNSDADEDGRHYVRLFDLHPSDSDVFTTLLRLFSSVDMDFEAAIKNDIYSDDGTAHAEEEDRKWTTKGHPPLGTHLTTTILWKSIVKGADGRGTTRRPIRHAVAHLDVELAHYDDALTNLLGGGRQSACFFLHGDAGEKIQFKSEANLTKTIDSVVDRLKEGLARRHLEEALESALGEGTLNVIVGPEEPHKVPDVADEAHLCVMDFDTVSVHDPEDVPSVIQTLHENTASSSGGQHSPRVYKNNIVFLAATGDAIRDAERTAQRVAAIKHIQNNLGEEFDLNERQQDELIERLDKAKGTLDQDIKKAYTHLYYPSDGGLAHRRITTDTTIHQAVIDKLEESGKIIPEGEGAYGVEWFEKTLWNKGADSMTTRALEEQFGKRTSVEDDSGNVHDVEILLSPIPLRKTIARMVSEGEYTYWDGEANTGYYSEDTTLHGHSSDLSDATNLQTGLDYRDVKLAKSHRVYDSVEELVEEVDVDWDTTITCSDCGQTFDSQEAYDEHDCDIAEKVTCDECDDTFGSQEAYQDHLPCSVESLFPMSASASTSSPYHVPRALKEMRADIDTAIERARSEYSGHPDEIITAVEGVWIRIEGADGWKGAWFTADKLGDSDEFAEHTLVNFDYTAYDESESMVDITYRGDPSAFADHFRFNMEPEDFSTPDGERTAEADFSIEFDGQDDPMLYGETFEALDDLLAVDNAFTVTMETEVEIRARDQGDS
ncbi:ATP-binding protein [Natronomonas gomsonensis]|uniref:ATP-binding protein n=1 Tax=Natronomonas gomsonensis TaxID=1046043 RepID=UPI0020CA39A2|nr:DUF499 domain-containing protein [Natronomonas gomsonensis]